MKNAPTSRGLKRSGLALITFLVAMIGVFWFMRQRYANHLQQQIWPAAMPTAKVIVGPSVGSQPTVLLLGDSRIAQWGLPSLAGWHVVNAGVGGLTTGQIRLRTPPLLDKFHPDVVVVEAGINDLKYLGLRPDLKSRLVSLVTDNLAAVTEACAKRHCKVILLEIWPPSRPSLARRLVWSAAVPESVTMVNERLQSLNSTNNRIRVVDLFSAAGLEPDGSLYRDTLHFKPKVYLHLASALEKELNAAIP